MPESVKISELTARTAVDSDLVPAVDSTFTQTVRVTAASIAAIGGGPPGNNTVTTAKLADGAVTYPKIQNVTATDRILGRATAGAGVVEEIPCSPLARSVLAATTSGAMCAAMGALNSTVEANFTGPARFADGTASAPSITNDGDTNTGIFFPYDNNLGFAADGYERLRIAEDGSQYSNFPGTSISTELRPHWPVRAWVNFNGTAAGSFTISSQHTICQRYAGIWGSLYDDAATRAKIADMESTTSGGTQTITAYGNVGTESRSNYTTPSNNVHYRWNGSQWVSIAATSGNWIGNITITNSAGVQVRGSGNVQSVVRNNTGLYTVNFVGAMPDTGYSAIGSCVANGGTPGLVRLVALNTGSVQIYTANSTTANSLYDCTTVCLAVIR